MTGVCVALRVDVQGALDRILPLVEAGLDAGLITREEAADLITKEIVDTVEEVCL